MLFELIGILAGIAIFIYSIEQLSEQLLKISRENLKGLIQRFTDHPIKALFTGIFATILLQSSTATTSILIALVDAGLVSFYHSIGVIAGSNIGTTITAQLVAFNFMIFAPFFLIAGFILTFVPKYNLIGKSIFLFGLLFYGLTIVSTTAKGLQDEAIVKDIIRTASNIEFAILFGFILTAIINSSSAVTALLVLLTMEGLLPFNIAIPMVLGSNIGTTLTALLVSRKMGVFAKRTAYAHVLFNVAGVIFIFPFIPSFIDFVSSISPNPGATVANAHTIFNVFAATIFILFAPFFVRLIESFTQSKEKEILFKPKYLDRIPADTDTAIRNLKLELVNHIEIAREMLDISTEMMVYKNTEKINQIEKLEALSDYLDSKITSTLVELSNRKLTPSQSREIVVLSKVANQIERLADIMHDYGHINVKLEENGLEFSKESIEDIMQLKFKIDEILDYLTSKFLKINKKDVIAISNKRREIDNLISYCHKMRINVLSREKFSTYATVLFIDAVAAFEETVSLSVRIAKNLSQIKD
ncbi:MAG: Na/Pi cotransporter family protein [Candidatus Micrarchaeota archaeon]|nr:Na/Pi cotransporter family protein [Candidatus Micrarchaeota archaeon]